MSRMFYDPIGPWHDWFAWYPVDTVTHGWKWMVTLERRRIQTQLHLPVPVSRCWEYRPKGGDA